jgi:hypothetical protein
LTRKKLLNSRWKPAKEKMQKKLGCWQGKMMDIGSGVILLNSCLTSIIFYMMSFYRLLIGVRKRCDFYRGRLLWQEEQGIGKYHLVNLETMCTPKDLGWFRGFKSGANEHKFIVQMVVET